MLKKIDDFNAPYTRKAVDSYALYHAVKLIDNEDKEYLGWLVPKGKDYVILPLNNIWNSYHFSISDIKAIYHLTNCVLIPKKFKG